MAEHRGIISRLGTLWRWSGQYRNARLVVLGVVMCLLPATLFWGMVGSIDLAAPLIGDAIPEKAGERIFWVICLCLLMFSFVALIALHLIVPFACWRAYRDRQRRIASEAIN